MTYKALDGTTDLKATGAISALPENGVPFIIGLPSQSNFTSSPRIMYRPDYTRTEREARTAIEVKNFDITANSGAGDFVSLTPQSDGRVGLESLMLVNGRNLFIRQLMAGEYAYYMQETNGGTEIAAWLFQDSYTGLDFTNRFFGQKLVGGILKIIESGKIPYTTGFQCLGENDRAINNTNYANDLTTLFTAVRAIVGDCPVYTFYVVEDDLYKAMINGQIDTWAASDVNATVMPDSDNLPLLRDIASEYPDLWDLAVQDTSYNESAALFQNDKILLNFSSEPSSINNTGRNEIQFTFTNAGTLAPHTVLATSWLAPWLTVTVDRTDLPTSGDSVTSVLVTNQAQDDKTHVTLDAQRTRRAWLQQSITTNELTQVPYTSANFLTDPSDFTSAFWSKAGVSVADNGDGTYNLTKGATTFRRIQQSCTLSSTGTTTVWFKFKDTGTPPGGSVITPQVSLYAFTATTGKKWFFKFDSTYYNSVTDGSSGSDPRPISKVGIDDDPYVAYVLKTGANEFIAAMTFNCDETALSFYIYPDDPNSATQATNVAIEAGVVRGGLPISWTA